MSWIEPRFATEDNFYNITRNFAFIGIMALGMTPVIITGGIDLSVGSVMGVVAIVSGSVLLTQTPAWMAGWWPEAAWAQPDSDPRLAKRFRVVYLTARDHSFLAKTRGWFRLHGLADGPVFMRRRRFWSQRAFDHKLERLGELTKERRIVAGVGDLPLDAKAYLARGMAAYVMDPGGAVPEIEGATRVRSWKELEERLSATSVPSAR